MHHTMDTVLMCGVMQLVEIFSQLPVAFQRSAVLVRTRVVCTVFHPQDAAEGGPKTASSSGEGIVKLAK